MDNNATLNHVLEKGEVIKWSGISQPFGLFDESRKTSTIMSLCWALAWGIIPMGIYYAYCVSNGIEIKYSVMGIFAAISLMIVWLPISDKSKVKKLQYAVTDKRIITVSKENNNPIAMRIADIDDIRVDKTDNGNCHIRIGSPVFKASSKKLPGMAYRGEYVDQDGNKTYKGLVFFNVSSEDGKTVSRLLKPVS